MLGAPMTAFVSSWLILGGLALLLIPQLVRGLGWQRGGALALALLAASGGGCWVLGRAALPIAPPADWHAVASVSSETCAKCHAEHYDSWHRTFHRTMTRD